MFFFISPEICHHQRWATWKWRPKIKWCLLMVAARFPAISDPDSGELLLGLWRRGTPPDCVDLCWLMEEGDKEGCNGKKNHPLLPDNFWVGQEVPKNYAGEALKGVKNNQGWKFIRVQVLVAKPRQRDGTQWDPPLIRGDNFWPPVLAPANRPLRVSFTYLLQGFGQ